MGLNASSLRRASRASPGGYTDGQRGRVWHRGSAMRTSLKLMLVTFTLLLIPLLSLSWASYQHSAAIVSRNQRDLMVTLLESHQRTLTTFQDQVNTLLLSVAADERLWAASDAEAERILDSYARYNTNISNLYIVRGDQRPVGVPRWQVRTLGRAVQPVLQGFIARGPGVWWTEPYDSPLSNWTVTAGVRAMGSGQSSGGFVFVDLPLLTLGTVLPPVRGDALATTVVFSDQQTPVVVDHTAPFLRYQLRTNQLGLSPAALQTLHAEPGDEIVSLTLDGTTFLSLSGAPNRFGWRPVVLLSNGLVEEATAGVQRSLLIALLLVSLLSLGLAWFVARFFSRPLEQLAQEMARVRLGQLDGVQLTQRRDEVGQLAAAFNEMMARIRVLIDDLRRTEQRKKEVEIHALQSQIKPHFLANTLNAIGYSAAMGRTDDVYRMIQSLTFLLTFTFDRVEEQVTLANELELIDHYVRLQRIRYGNSFEVVYDVEPEVGRFLLPKLTLQPIVENAVFHGLAQRGQGGLLRIGAHAQTGRLVITISDNGPGVDLGALPSPGVDMPAEQRPHIGLRNTRERLQLHYGEQAALTILPDPTGVGTLVTVVLPVQFATSAPGVGVIPVEQLSGI